MAPIKHVVISGATGYIGGRLAHWLAAQGVAVTAIVRPGSLRLRRDELNARRVEALPYSGDVRGLTAELRARPAQAAFHLAGLSLAHCAPDRVGELVDANVRFGTEFLEASVAAGCPVFVSTGTFWQHGSGGDAYHPTCLYAATKQAFQDILAHYVEAGLRAVTLKLFDVYGPGDPRGRIVDLLLDAQAGGAAVDMSPGWQALDLVHVDDVLRAYWRAAELLSLEPLPRPDYAVGTGERVRLRELVQLIDKLSGRKASVRWGARPYRAREVMTPWRGPFLPGWRPQIDLERGLQELIEARRSERPALAG
jgi:nucleoside-diphosphate-sugar epimerase